MKTVEQIIKNLKKDLAPYLKRAKETQVEAKAFVEAFRKSKSLMRRGRRYSLNPRRVGRIVPYNLGKSNRKEAKKVAARLVTELENLILNKRVIFDEAYRVSNEAECAATNLENLNKALETLLKWREQLEDRGKLFNYARRRELELHQRVFGDGPTKTRRKITKGQRKRGVEMSPRAKKDEIQKLLNQLRKATDATDKRKIRVELRSLGHKGGLGEGRGRPKSKKVKKTKKVKKAKRNRKQEAA